MKYFTDRLREPSTLAGLAAIAVSLGVDATAANGYVQVVSAILGLLAMVIPEKSA